MYSMYISCRRLAATLSAASGLQFDPGKQSSVHVLQGATASRRARLTKLDVLAVLGLKLLTGNSNLTAVAVIENGRPVNRTCILHVD